MKKIFRFLIRVYQLTISPVLGPHCRFAPSCSHYALEAVEKKGFVRGLTQSLSRLLRCHPLSHGGYDPA